MIHQLMRSFHPHFSQTKIQRYSILQFVIYFFILSNKHTFGGKSLTTLLLSNSDSFNSYRLVYESGSIFSDIRFQDIKLLLHTLFGP